MAFDQNNPCARFRNGKFKIVDAEKGSYTIERQGKHQIEYSEQTGTKVEFAVKWLSNCTFTLKLRKVLENPNNLPIPQGLTMDVQIIETRENSYIQKISSGIIEMELQDEVFLIG